MLTRSEQLHMHSRKKRVGIIKFLLLAVGLTVVIVVMLPNFIEGGEAGKMCIDNGLSKEQCRHIVLKCADEANRYNCAHDAIEFEKLIFKLEHTK